MEQQEGRGVKVPPDWRDKIVHGTFVMGAMRAKAG